MRAGTGGRAGERITAEGFAMLGMAETGVASSDELEAMLIALPAEVTSCRLVPALFRGTDARQDGGDS